MSNYCSDLLSVTALSFYSVKNTELFGFRNQLVILLLFYDTINYAFFSVFIWQHQNDDCRFSQSRIWTAKKLSFSIEKS